MVRIVLCVLLFMFINFSSTQADNTRFLTAGTTRARALAMGSAYHSIEDDFSAGFYNPGAFKLNASRSERKFRVFLNPVASVVAFYDYATYNRDFVVDDKLTFQEILIASSMFLKGAVYTTPVVDIGLGFEEEVFLKSTASEKLSKRVFSAEGLTKCSFNSAFMNFRIAPQVSLGIAGTLYNSREGGESSYKGGYAFSVLLLPHPKMNVGIVYNEIPDDFSTARMGLEDIEGGTASSGISYYPDNKTVLSIDLRNLNKENDVTSREIHTGIERRLGDRIAMRAGYFRRKSNNDNIFSFGIGFLPLWEKIKKKNNSTRNDIFSYTLIMEEIGFKRCWHVFSLLLRC